MSSADPRLEPVLADARADLRGDAVLGTILVATGIGVALIATVGGDPIATLVLVLASPMFWLPGVLLLRRWRRGPEARPLVKLLATDRGRIGSWDLAYVSRDGGPTRTRITVFLRGGGVDSVELPPEAARRVIDYVAETAPRRPQA